MGLVSVIVSNDVPFTAMLDGENDFVTVSGGVTTSVALAAVALVPAEVLSAPTAMVLTDVKVAVTFTVTVQLPFAGMVPPESATFGPFAAAVAAPPQVVAADGELVFVIVSGYVSVNAADVIATLVPLVSVMVNTLVPPGQLHQIATKPSNCSR